MSTGLENQLFRNLFGTPAVGAIFSTKGTLSAWLAPEAALAEAQRSLNVIPPAAAAAIATACAAEDYDIDAFEAEICSTLHPLVPIVRATVQKPPARWRNGCIGAQRRRIPQIPARCCRSVRHWI